MHHIISTLAGLKAIEEDWNRLAVGSGNPLLRYEWIRACIEAYHEGDALAVIVIRRNGELVAAAPMVRCRKAGIARLSILTESVGEPNGVLFADEAALDELTAAVLGESTPAIMTKFKLGSPVMSALRRLAPRHLHYVLKREASSTAWVALGSDWDAFEASMSSGQRSYIRRKRKRAERHGAVVFEAIAPTESDVERHLDTAFRVEAAGWKGREGTAILSDARMERFYRNYTRDAARLGLLRIFFLRIGDEVAAMRVATAYAGRLWELKIGYDERWRDCSPGIILTHETLRWACENGIEAHEFLGAAEDWQNAWLPQLHAYGTAYIYPLSPAGAIATVEDALRVLGRTLSAKINVRLADSRDLVAPAAPSSTL